MSKGVKKNLTNIVIKIITKIFTNNKDKNE